MSVRVGEMGITALGYETRVGIGGAHVEPTDRPDLREAIARVWGARA
jgi:hypothetical protein